MPKKLKKDWWESQPPVTDDQIALAEQQKKGKLIGSARKAAEKVIK